MAKTAAETEAPPSSAWLSKGEKSIRAIIYEKIETRPKSVKDVLLKFAGERYSGHGLKRVAGDDGRYINAVWVIIFLCFVGLAGFGLFHFFCEFLHFRKISSTVMTYNEEVRFPAVTVCNENAIDTKKVEQYFGKTYSDPGGTSYTAVPMRKDLDLIWRLYRFDKSLTEQYETTDTTDTCTDVLEAAMCAADQVYCANTSPSTSYGTGSGALKAVVDDSQDADEMRAKLSFTREQLEEFAFTYDDLVTDCTFDGQPCTSSQRHVWKHSKYGTCITFNGAVGENAEAISTTKYGQMHGLKLKLNANLKRYINAISSGHGFRVSLHDSKQVAFPEENGYDIPAGKKTQMAVNTKYVDRLGKPYGKCGGAKPDRSRGYTGGWLWGSRKDPYHMDKVYTSKFDDRRDAPDSSYHRTDRVWEHDGEYTESGCRKFYRNAIFEDRCSCTKVLDRTHVKSDYVDCDITDEAMGTCMAPLDERLSLVNCYPPCQENQYKPVLITGLLDEGPVPDLSFDNAKRVLDAEFCVGGTANEAGLASLGYKTASEKETIDTTELAVFLQSPRIEKTFEYPKYQVQQFLFHVAGVLLLLLGSSVFIIPEILELILDLLCALVHRNKEQTEDDQYTSEEVMIEYPEINELSTNLDEICGGIFAIPDADKKGPAPPVPEKRPKSNMSIAYDIPAFDDCEERPKSTKSIAYDIPAN